jgi:cadmium resistance protein CadD (predicted permease)
MASLSLVGVSAIAFMSTNVDNFVLTTAQVAAARAERVRRIAFGAVAGFALLVGVSAVVASALGSIPTRWIGLLGLVPLVLGVRGLWALRRPEARSGTPRWPIAGGFITAALTTIGSGGDNLAVYIPLLRNGNLTGGLAIAGVLMALDLALVGVAIVAGRHPRTLGGLERAGAFATPVLYCVIGVVVLVRSGTLAPLV